MRTGIVLSGGGARGAYQAGVLRALCEVSVSLEQKNPFHVIAGLSAGAINGSYLASHCDDLSYLGPAIAKLWSQLETESVINVSPMSVGRIGAKLIRQYVKSAKTSEVKGMVDTGPLHGLLKEHLRYNKIDENLKNGVFNALAVTATNYKNSNATTFVQSHAPYKDWQRVRRGSQKAAISVDHIMASSAIPMVFPSVELDGTHYGDGGIRNTSPLSPAIHLGAKQLIVVGVCMKDVGAELSLMGAEKQPSMAHVLSVLVHGLLMDAIDLDIERLERFNEMAEALQGKKINGREYTKVDYLWISPSKYIGEIAMKYEKAAPAGIRFIMSGLGSEAERADLFSYLLFEKEYMQELVALGYDDGMAQRDEIKRFLKRADQ